MELRHAVHLLKKSLSILTEMKTEGSGGLEERLEAHAVNGRSLVAVVLCKKIQSKLSSTYNR